MIGPNDPPRLGVDSLRRGVYVPLWECCHETRDSFTGGELKFKTKGCAVKGMRGLRAIALAGREGKFTVVNHIGSEASFK